MNAPAASTIPRIGAGFRLQWEPAQDCHVLLYPEGMVKLPGSAGEIMKRVDGTRSVDIEATGSRLDDHLILLADHDLVAKLGRQLS